MRKKCRSRRWWEAQSCSGQETHGCIIYSILLSLELCPSNEHREIIHLTGLLQWKIATTTLHSLRDLCLCHSCRQRLCADSSWAARSPGTLTAVVCSTASYLTLSITSLLSSLTLVHLTFIVLISCHQRIFSGKIPYCIMFIVDLPTSNNYTGWFLRINSIL